MNREVIICKVNIRQWRICRGYRKKAIVGKVQKGAVETRCTDVQTRLVSGIRETNSEICERI